MGWKGVREKGRRTHKEEIFWEEGQGGAKALRQEQQWVGGRAHRPVGRRRFGEGGMIEMG